MTQTEHFIHILMVRVKLYQIIQINFQKSSFRWELNYVQATQTLPPNEKPLPNLGEYWPNRFCRASFDLSPGMYSFEAGFHFDSLEDEKFHLLAFFDRF